MIALIGLAVMAYDTFDRNSTPKFCTLEGIVTADGRVYSRDADQDCTFVDQNGNVMPGQ